MFTINICAPNGVPRASLQVLTSDQVLDAIQSALGKLPAGATIAISQDGSVDLSTLIAQYQEKLRTAHSKAAKNGYSNVLLDLAGNDPVASLNHRVQVMRNLIKRQSLESQVYLVKLEIYEEAIVKLQGVNQYV